MQWNKVALIGVGLLGGSLGIALKKRRLAKSVVGFVRRAASVRECRKLEAVDLATRDLLRAVKGADLIVFCTPIAQMLPLARKMLGGIESGAIMTDVGSVKGALVRDLAPLVARAGAHFIGSHPMAGSEKMGVRAARADLFEDAVCVVTPTHKSNKGALQRVEKLWQAVGARVIRLSPASHDAFVSRTSHLPHLLAAQLANFVLDPKQPGEQALLCANGFRDTTRIASGSPEMWRDIALANRENLTRTLDQFISELQNFSRALRKGNQAGIARLFESAKQRRDGWSAGTRVFSEE